LVIQIIPLLGSVLVNTPTAPWPRGSSVQYNRRLRKKPDIGVTLHPPSLRSTISTLPTAPAIAVFLGIRKP
jgi:hypothetical protein